MKYIAALDQSTTGTKAMLFDETGTLRCRTDKTHHQYYPRPGWVEQDAAEIFEQTCEVLRALLAEAAVPEQDILALAITVQTGAFVVWDKATGQPVHHIIGWQCSRGEEICSRLSAAQAAMVRAKSGTDPSGYLPAAKLQWMLENVPGLRERAERGEVLFGTIETWLVWKLTNGRVHGSDYCNASITQLFNVEKLCWDDELLQLFGVPRAMLPQLMNADADFGRVTVPGLPPLRITGVIGDSAAALFGQRGFTQGDVKVTYGTGCSILMNLGPVPMPPAEGMTTSVGWRMGADEVTYVWEGTAVYAGAVISWLVHDMELLPDAKSSEAVARTVEDASGVYLVPAFTGLGAPYRDAKARACILGMQSGTKRAHIVRAALDCIAYQVKDMAESMAKSADGDIRQVLVDGGITRNRLVMQFQADLLRMPLICSAVEESSGLGVALMAGIAVGLYPDREALRQLPLAHDTFTPQMPAAQAEAYYAGWQRAIRQVRSAE